MYGYVYKVQFGSPLKCYISQHIANRFNKTYFNTANPLVQRYITEYKEWYGEDWKKFIQVKCLYKCDTEKELNDKEQLAILEEHKHSIIPITDFEYSIINHQTFGRITLFRRKIYP